MADRETSDAGPMGIIGALVAIGAIGGSSAQRQRWFTAGLKEGKVSACNTFAASSL